MPDQVVKRCCGTCMHMGGEESPAGFFECRAHTPRSGDELRAPVLPTFGSDCMTWRKRPAKGEVTCPF